MAVIPWGLAGAAIATMLSQAVTGGLCLWHFFTPRSQLRIRWDTLVPDWRLMGETLRLGVSSFLMYLYLSVVLALHNKALLAVGTSLHVAGLRAAVVSGVSSLAVLAAWAGEFPTQLRLFTMEPASSFSLGSLLAWTFAGGFVGGWLSSALALILTPILENILDYTTELKLLELARGLPA